MLKKLVALPLVALAVAIPSHADPVFTKSGTILVAGPSGRVVGGVTEIASPCMGSVDPDVPAGATQGVDGYWVELPLGLDGRAAHLTANAPNEVDAWFYDEGCGLITPTVDANAYSMVNRNCLPVPPGTTSYCPLPSGDKHGTVPVGAAWVAVDLNTGANANFTFSVD
jgi:hypothetical protein